MVDDRRCVAHAKSTGERCRRYAVAGFPTCQVHGSGSPQRGRPGGRPIVTGRYSTRLPERLASRYAEALADSHLLELRDEVALVDTRIADRLQTLESRAAWLRLKELYGELDQARRSGDAAQFGVQLTLLGEVISAGVMEEQAWLEIVALVDTRRRLVESERKRLVEMQQMITSERAMILLAAIVSIIRDHVSDSGTLAAISHDIRRLTEVEP